MKKKCKGFTLLETLMVSVFIASALVYLFIQINNIKTNYDITFRYDTIPGLYGCQEVDQFLTSIHAYSGLDQSLGESEFHYIDITDGSFVGEGSSIYYRDLINKLNIK